MDIENRYISLVNYSNLHTHNFFYEIRVNKTTIFIQLLL